MANPLQNPGVSPLMHQLVQRQLRSSPGIKQMKPLGYSQDLTMPSGNLAPEVPKLRPPTLRPRRFTVMHPRTVLQPKNRL